MLVELKVMTRVADDEATFRVLQELIATGARVQVITLDRPIQSVYFGTFSGAKEAHI